MDALGQAGHGPQHSPGQERSGWGRAACAAAEADLRPGGGERTGERVDLCMPRARKFCIYEAEVREGHLAGAQGMRNGMNF